MTIGTSLNGETFISLAWVWGNSYFSMVTLVKLKFYSNNKMELKFPWNDGGEINESWNIPEGNLEFPK